MPVSVKGEALATRARLAGWVQGLTRTIVIELKSLTLVYCQMLALRSGAMAAYRPSHPE